MRIGHEHGRQPVLGELEDRAARARDGEVGGGQRLAERDQVVAQVVVRAGRREVGEVAPPGDVQDAVRRVGERGDRGVVDRARAERAAEHEHAALVVADAERGARGRAAGGARGDGPAGDDVVARPSRPAIGNARHTRWARRGSRRLVSPMCESASVSTSGTRRSTAASADRAGDVAAAAQHRVGRGGGAGSRARRRSASAALATARSAFSGFVREMPSTRIGSSG